MQIQYLNTSHLSAIVCLLHCRPAYLANSTHPKMSTSTPHRRPGLADIPDDVAHQILDHLSPADIANYALLNRATLKTVTDPFVWASAARRHLAIVSPNLTTSSSLHDMAKSLACHWSVFTGLIAEGCPVHIRSGFAWVVARGGIEVPLHRDKPESAYVFGGRFSDRAVPSSLPSLDLHVALDPKGPFPVNGLRCRVVHAAEPCETDVIGAHAHTIRGCKNTNSDVQFESMHSSVKVSQHGDNQGQFHDRHINQGSEKLAEAQVTVKLNGHIITHMSCRPTTEFQAWEFNIPSDRMVTKPALNYLSIEYGRGSTAGYWLRDVAVSPTFLSFPELDIKWLDFPLAKETLAKAERSAKRGNTATLTQADVDQELKNGFLAPSASSSASSSSSALSPSSSSDGSDGSRASGWDVGESSGVRMTPLVLEQLGESGISRQPNSPKQARSSTNKHSSNLGKQQQRPKHLHHKQNFHHRSSRAQHQQHNVPRSSSRLKR